MRQKRCGTHKGSHLMKLLLRRHSGALEQILLCTRPMVLHRVKFKKAPSGMIWPVGVKSGTFSLLCSLATGKKGALLYKIYSLIKSVKIAVQ